MGGGGEGGGGVKERCFLEWVWPGEGRGRAKRKVEWSYSECGQRNRLRARGWMSEKAWCSYGE